ncbi:MAG: hypothetical protein ACRESQ_09245, partial [Gammaproteobacteria bacterium]
MSVAKKLSLIVVLALVTSALFAGLRWYTGLRMMPLALAAEASALAGSVTAPAFPPGLDWINTGGKPVTLKELRGKVVLLDFWTYGCINCFHI